ncbi:MAG: DNA-directed RNA polymerase subunit omega [Oscillospiraceae bacterium]
MMLYPPMADLVEKVGSRYLLVNLVARRARDIYSNSEENDFPLDKKPVSCAIDEVFTGKLKIFDQVEAAARADKFNDDSF